MAVYVSAEVYQDLKARSEAENRSKSQIIADALMGKDLLRAEALSRIVKIIYCQAQQSSNKGGVMAEKDTLDQAPPVHWNSPR